MAGKRDFKTRTMPKRLDGTGRVWIRATYNAFEVLKLDELPWGDGRSLEDGRPRINIGPSRRGGGGRNKLYRVRMERPDDWDKKADPTISFCLSSGHINETLAFLADFWREKEIPFQRITNEYGNGFNNDWASAYDTSQLKKS